MTMLTDSKITSDPLPLTLVFDLGGTWWRVGLLSGKQDVPILSCTPAINWRNKQAPIEQLQQELVDFVIGRAKDYLPVYNFLAVGISLGAAIDGRTGMVLASAPLWGPDVAPLDLLASLRQQLPDLTWAILNDVSALAAALLTRRLPGRRRKAAAVTISSRIAYRTIDLRSGRIPLDPDHGLQGEIGHLPCQFVLDGRTVTATCECGTADHLAAFSSGRGMEKLLGWLPEAEWLRRESLTSQALVANFAKAVRQGNARALTLLDEFTHPLARILLYQATLDPEVDHTVLSGGVVDGFGDAYLASLLRNLQNDGLYGISDRDPSYFARRFYRSSDTEFDALRGARRGSPRRAAVCRRGSSPRSLSSRAISPGLAPSRHRA
jgi:predicted NBD/HSP70 family sugar kinase